MSQQSLILFISGDVYNELDQKVEITDVSVSEPAQLCNVITSMIIIIKTLLVRVLTEDSQRGLLLQPSLRQTVQVLRRQPGGGR